jgi:hypothetical protein
MDEVTTAAEESVPTPVSVELVRHSHSSGDGLLCALALAACVLIAYPVANMPFMDDFSYTKTALDFAQTGHFLYNGWATAMLGWLVPWGALFIKLFGFSFTAVRFSMLPIAMATVYLFHQILRRFGINRGNAVLGALTLALSPLFLPMAASFMTDVPGLFVILACIAMCQRAVAAQADKAALLWLCSAMVVNVAGGTVRQIAWLGALIMVPSAAWLLRERRGMRTAGVLLFLCGLVGVLACLHWFNEQPYSVPEHVFVGPIHPKMLVHLGAQLFKTFLCLLLVIFPVSVMWLPVSQRLTANAKIRIIGALTLLCLLAAIPYKFGRLDPWLMPWLIPLLESQAVGGVKVWMRIGISLLIIAPALVMLEQMAIPRRIKPASVNSQAPAWVELAWILGPFSLSYVLLLAPRATFAIIQDRYLLGLAPTAIIVLLRLYQDRIGDKVPAISLVILMAVAFYAVAGAHDLFAGCRALVRTVQMVQNSGVPRRYIQAGMASDGWAQIEGGGHINDSRIQVPAGAYNPDTPNLKLSNECTLEFASLTPAITPKYFLLFPPMSCFAPAKYPPVRYATWLPPFHRALYVQQLKTGAK